MLVLDTSALVAATYVDDRLHEHAMHLLEGRQGIRLVPVSIFAEVAYMLRIRVGPSAVRDFVRDVRSGALTSDWDPADIERVGELMGRYADLRLDFADACVIACAERRGIPVLTGDARDFGVVAKEGTFEFIALDGSR